MDHNAIFRPMRIKDVPGVAEMEAICFRSPWTERMLRNELHNPVAKYHVIELNGFLISYAGMWIVCDEAHITNVAVLPEYRRQGYGRYIMLQVMRSALHWGAAVMTLEVRESNHSAQELYRQLGFETVGKRKGYYTDTKEDALILWNRAIGDTVRRLRS